MNIKELERQIESMKDEKQCLEETINHISGNIKEYERRLKEMREKTQKPIITGWSTVYEVFGSDEDDDSSEGEIYVSNNARYYSVEEVKPNNACEAINVIFEIALDFNLYGTERYYGGVMKIAGFVDTYSDVVSAINKYETDNKVNLSFGYKFLGIVETYNTKDNQYVIFGQRCWDIFHVLKVTSINGSTATLQEVAWSFGEVEDYLDRMISDYENGKNMYVTMEDYERGENK